MSVQNQLAIYNRKLTYLVLMLTLCALGCIFLGYIVLPFAAAYFAALIYFEKPEKRVFSYLIPVTMFLVNFIARGFSLNGLLSLDAIAYVVLGVIIYLTYVNNKKKSDGAFYGTLMTVILMLISLIFLAFNSLNAFGISAIEQFYMPIFSKCKAEIVDVLTSVVIPTDDGGFAFAFNVFEAEAVCEEMMFLLIPTLILTAFLIVGIAFKVFSGLLAKHDVTYTPELWRFVPTNSIAYFYIATAILSMLFSTATGVFEYTITILNIVLMAVFAYLGITFVYAFLSSLRGSVFAFLVVFLAILFLSYFAIQLLSFIGVYYVITYNKAKMTKNNS